MNRTFQSLLFIVVVTASSSHADVQRSTEANLANAMPTQNHRKLSIMIDPLAWGSQKGYSPADHARDIKVVLESCANSIWQHCTSTTLDTIVVRHRDDHPQADFARDSNGRISVGLHTEGMRWAQFSFQFAHEFCHVLADQSNDPSLLWHSTDHPNHWLEECLCETASLFALREMSKSWLKSPPYPHWRDYSISLHNYAQERMDDPVHQLPKEIAFLDWFHQNEHLLRAAPVDRRKNTIVASHLLPLFEDDPGGWECITFINRGKRVMGKTLESHLREWRINCPLNLKPFVTKIAGLFGVDAGDTR